MIKVLIADDHPEIREGLKLILQESPDITVAGEAGNAQEVLEQVLQNDIEVVLLDIAMPGRNGLEVLCQLRNLKSSLRNLILSSYPEEQYAVRALKAGAAGYLTKASAPEELITAIRKVSRGEKYLCTSLAEKIGIRFDR